MAHHKSAKKRIKVSEKRRQNNKTSISKSRTLVKKVLDTEDKAEAVVALKEAVSYLDKTAGKGRLHKNTVARKKSRLTRHVNKLAAAAK
jgi:small subunit ribosomal protein S20